MGNFKVAMEAKMVTQHSSTEVDVVVKLPHTLSGADTLAAEFVAGQMQRDVVEQTQVGLLLKFLQLCRPAVFGGVDIVLPSIACLNSSPDIPFIIEDRLNSSFTKQYPQEIDEVVTAMQCLVVKATKGAWLIEDVQGQLSPPVFTDVQLKCCNSENQERNDHIRINNLLPFVQTHVCNCYCQTALKREEVERSGASNTIWDDVEAVENHTPFALNA
eukprot:TRINITY_DN64640_c0_g1_i3.p2 TRINITY_DN64640_c0_g1~~TRINITY_DN64640_c0_g1_i3.p2  ORF type:complete len:216 (+),score=25.98 TRINITY_DN64640_c0_g1_i3:1332-1979(+)